MPTALFFLDLTTPMIRSEFVFNLGFFLITLCALAGHALEIEVMSFVFKPLIMLTLGGFFYLQVRGHWSGFAKMMLAAISFSWFGDILLLLEKVDPGMRYYGFGSLLIAQVLYARAFIESVRYSSDRSAYEVPGENLLFSLPFVVYGGLIYYLLFDKLDSFSMKIGVAVYTMSIVSMAVLAFNRFGAVTLQSALMVFYGSFLLIVSDSCVAIDTFLIPFYAADFVILFTYIFAQYLIMRGCLRQIRPTGQETA